MRVSFGSTAPIIDIATRERIDNELPTNEPGIGHTNGAATMQASAQSDGQATPSAPPLARAKPNDPLAGMTAKMVFTDCIWISKETPINKILLLCISRFFKPNATTATMSYSRLAEDCGFSVRTGIRAAKEVRDRWLRIGVQKGHRTASGQNNLYVGTPPPELVEELRRRKAKGDVITPDDTIVEVAEGMTQSHTLPDQDVTQSHALGTRGDSLSKRGDRDDTLNTKKQKEDIRTGAGAPSVAATLTEKTPTPKKGSRCKPSDADIDEVIAAYNEAAKAYGWSCCGTLTPPRRKRLEQRLTDIGGPTEFKRALVALVSIKGVWIIDLLMGRLQPRPGDRGRFHLDIDKLLQTSGNLGDVLARLIDAVGEVPHRQKATDAGMDWDATYEQMSRDRGEA